MNFALITRRLLMDRDIKYEVYLRTVYENGNEEPLNYEEWIERRLRREQP